MSIDSIIRDGIGGKFAVQVTSEHALKVSPVTIATADQTITDLTLKKQYRDWLRTTGGGYEMNLDASSGAILFTETAEANKVKWITSWRLILNGTEMELETNDFRGFGAAAGAPGLTNGVDFYFIQGGRQINVFLNSVKNIGSFLDYADGYTNLVNAVTSQSDYLAFDFIFDQPVALPAGSNDKIVMQINDDLTDIDLMRVVVRGWQEFTS
jgi:hypothetical protein